MDAICAHEQYADRIAANPNNGELLHNMDAQDFIAALTRWRDLFVAGRDLPVFGVTEAELNSIETPTIVIPGNDKTHDSNAGRIVHQMIPGSELHQLPIEDQDLPLVPFEDWAPLEPEITQVFADFMRRHGAG